MRILFFVINLVIATSVFSQPTIPTTHAENPDEMINQFTLLHQQLMPRVAVADMFYGCHFNDHLKNNSDLVTKDQQYSFSYLINEMDKNTLAIKLMACLGEDSIASDKALNFGIKACFIDQFSELPELEQAQALTRVDTAIQSLAKAERQQSFTKCVNNQTLKYLAK